VSLDKPSGAAKAPPDAKQFVIACFETVGNRRPNLERQVATSATGDRGRWRKWFDLPVACSP
jgi:hypothetical protein